ncbi:hypothetical protein HDU88_000974 [Geranomyces variabilis]|nr:hypothetical protein HDU88_000974 [Geranomyces variabilis]
MSLQITQAATAASHDAPEEYLTGSVKLTPLVKANEPSCLSCLSVTFQPGARTAWHSHPKGQLLIVTAGSGYIQAEGKAVERISAGMTIWTPPGVKHWHGAEPTAMMTHTAVQEGTDGEPAIRWMEKVTEQEYRGGV